VANVLVFGGSFDPVHNGHVAMLEAAIAQLQPARSLVIPVGNAWQKSRMPFAAGRHRVAMLKLAMPAATIDDRELSRGGPTYSVDTLRELKRDYANDSFVWLLGGDAFERLASWEEAIALSKLTRFAVVRRASEALTPPAIAVQFDVIECDPPAVSSTVIRAHLARRESVRDLVPAAVCDYIDHHQLYQP
jgi:nicotinate-nucleotide adenylyltransferase